MATNRTLTVRDIITLHGALSSLDGYAHIIKGEDGKDKSITVPYKFTGKVRWNIAKALTITKTYTDNYTKTRDAAINEISGGVGSIKEGDTEKIGRLNMELSSLLEVKEEVVGLLSFTQADLNLDDNPIPVSVLTALTPLLE